MKAGPRCRSRTGLSGLEVPGTIDIPSGEGGRPAGNPTRDTAFGGPDDMASPRGGDGVTDGTCTRSPQVHSLLLYCLSYGHHGASVGILTLLSGLQGQALECLGF